MRGGALRVGPRSARARPGCAAATGRGGQHHVLATITDANPPRRARPPRPRVLPRRRDGRPDADAASAGPSPSRVAAPLGLDPLAAASGIVEIANAHMIGAMRLVSVQRGHHPRDFVLVAFGRAGPVHANNRARLRSRHIRRCSCRRARASRLPRPSHARRWTSATSPRRCAGCGSTGSRPFADARCLCALCRGGRGAPRPATARRPRIGARRAARKWRYHGQSFEAACHGAGGSAHRGADPHAAARRVPRRPRARLWLRGAGGCVELVNVRLAAVLALSAEAPPRAAAGGRCVTSGRSRVDARCGSPKRAASARPSCWTGRSSWRRP